MKFCAAFRGVRSGDVYPTSFNPGDDCPEELIEAAMASGAIMVEQKVVRKAPERK